MELSTLFACLGVSVTLYGVFAYLKGIIKGSTQPRMASWVAWCTANTVFTIVAFGEGAWLAVGINGISSITNTVIIAMSLKKGVKLRPDDWIDWACLTSSIFCVIVTVISPAKELGAITAMLANAIATIPTLRHAWNKPHEESWQFFAANVGAGSISVLGVIMATGLTFGSIAGPLMVFIGNSSMLVITVVRRGWIGKIEQEIVHDIQVVEEVLVKPSVKGEGM